MYQRPAIHFLQERVHMTCAFKRFDGWIAKWKISVCVCTVFIYVCNHVSNVYFLCVCCVL